VKETAKADQVLNFTGSLCHFKLHNRFTYMLFDHKKQAGLIKENVSKVTGIWLADTVSLLRSLK